MPLTDRGSYLRLLSDHIYDTDRVLQLLPVYICAGAELYDLRGSGIFPGSVPDHQHRIADRHVGNPILWNLDALSPKWIMILKLNPLVYIVNGYRSAIYEKEWFFQDFFSTMYFWIVTVVLFGLGAVIFKRLKVHFADVL